MLFSTINRLLRPIDAPHPSDALNLCSKFLDFFQAKVDSIYQQLLQPASPPLHTHVTHRMCLPSFSPGDAPQIVELVTKAKASTCPLDSMPTTLVKACLPTLCPVMVDIINTSLESGIVPSSFKTAAVTPILKKPGLDPGLLSIPHTSLRTFGDRAFSAAAPTLWNSLPAEIRNAASLDIFKKALKTYLLTMAYGL
ncbi:hypothetical protein SKAU_G00020760 [Synaphobranchus kaupii]|uniref:Reverse transcriptase domain-containing protein n=1 Tax=Synaphobranchus kaupii TaxID=118154 RepID=A0A9Q1JD38_SYNKA|nr:hypothetical protein SKAU_G00020760 [Synaphobranchus kaupii]